MNGMVVENPNSTSGMVKMYLLSSIGNIDIGISVFRHSWNVESVGTV